MKFRLIYSFIFSTFAAISFSAFIPFYKPVFYAPFLAISFLSTTFISCLWLSCFGGFIIDILSSTHMGLNCLVYTLLTVIFYKQRRYFIDSPANIALFTILISFFYMLLTFILLYVLDKGVRISSISFLTDFVVLPLLDGIYAVVFFVLPTKTIEVISKKIKGTRSL